MSLTNLNNAHLTQEQKESVNNALTVLEQAFAPLQVKLSPEERKRYGRVNEQNKLFIGKVYDFAQSHPDLRADDVNWEEFAKDFNSRQFLEQIINKLEVLMVRAKNAKTLHDYDNYQDALTDYAYTSFRAGSKALGYETKNKELKQFFRRKIKTEDKPTSEEA